MTLQQNFQDKVEKELNEKWNTKWINYKDFEKLKKFLIQKCQEAQEAKVEEIREDLMKIADDGEIEDLRREVVRYFN
jgi:phosphoserine phosphatase